MEPEANNRGRQFNFRLSDGESGALARLAVEHGVTPSEYLRHLIRQAAAESKTRRLSPLHYDLLTAMSDHPKKAMSVIELLNEVPSRAEDGQLGNRISLALADLEERGHVQRAPVPGRSYTISVSGIEIAKERR
jgi:hypothetical protein